MVPYITGKSNKILAFIGLRASLFLVLLMIPVLLVNAQETTQRKKIPVAFLDKFVNETKFKKAEKLFDDLAYTEAKILYEELYASSYNADKVVRRLADCYRLTGDTEKAERMYSQVVKTDSVSVNDFFNYAQVLRSNGKYDESVEWMKKFNVMNSGDSRGISYAQSDNFIKEILARPEICTLKLFTEINSPYSDFGAFLFNRKIVFASGRNTGMTFEDKYAWDNKPFLDLFYAVKTDTGGYLIFPYSKKINSRYHEGPACLTDDGLTMYFTRNNFANGHRKNSSKGINNLRIFKCTFSGEEISTPTDLPFNSDEYSVGHPSLDEKNQRLYFASDMPGGMGGSDIYYVTVNNDGTYGNPVNLGNKVNTEGNELFPFWHPAGVLFFSSNGQVGLGGLDIFMAEPDASGTFTRVENMGVPINSRQDDFSFFLDKEQKNGFISSNRPGGQGDDDIWSFSLNKPVYLRIPVRVIVNDKETDKTVPGSVVRITDGEGKIYAQGITGQDGVISFMAEPDKEYKVAVQAEKYLPNTDPISTMSITDSKEISSVIKIEKDPGFMIKCLITDRNTLLPLKGAEILIIDKKNNSQVADFKTGDDGLFSKPLTGSRLNDELYYEIKLKCEGYLDKSFAYYKKLTAPGEILLNEELDLKMDKIEVGTDLAKIIDIKPIYFDLGKSDIRPDAAVELDKIVQVMNDNPNMIIELRSHTDSRGDDASNLRLSDKRAKASAQYIISKGIDPSRINGKGYGETMLLNKCGNGIKCTEEEHQQNRRTEFIIVKM